MLAVVRPVLTTTGLVLAYYLLPIDGRLTGGAGISLVAGLVGVSVLFGWQIRSIARSPHPRLRAVEALAVTLPLFLLLFAAVYHLMENTEPGSFTQPLSRTDSLYFSMVVFSTVGFGDITPRSETAHVVVMVQMAADILIVGVAARLVVVAIQAGERRWGQRGA